MHEITIDAPLSTGRRNMIIFEKYMIVRTKTKIDFLQFEMEGDTVTSQLIKSVQNVPTISEDAMDVFPDGQLACAVGNSIRLYDIKSGICVKTISGSFDIPWTCTLLSDHIIAFGCSKYEHNISLFIADMNKNQVGMVITPIEHKECRALVSLGYGLIAFSTDLYVHVYDIEKKKFITAWAQSHVQDMVVLKSGTLICVDLQGCITMYNIKPATYDDLLGYRMQIAPYFDLTVQTF